MMHTTRSSLPQLHWPLIIVIALIGACGIYNLHSAAAARDPGLYLTQFYWMLVAVAIISVFLMMDYRVSEGLAYPFYVCVCALLLVVLLQGKVAKGAGRWLVLGPATFQPSEFAKLAVVFCLARYFSLRSALGGYTMGSLFKPLNLSRPLAAIAVVSVFWRKAWLLDPIGELSRGLYRKLGEEIPQPGNLLWLRLLLLISIMMGGIAVIFFIARYERHIALLNPWPPGRRNRLILLTVVFTIFAIVMLVLKWDNVWLRDPFGVLIARLAHAGAPGGRYAELRPGLLLRIILAGLAAFYLLIAFLRLRTSFTTWSEVLIAPVDLVIIPVALVLVQPDLGTAGVIVLVGMTMILVVGIRLRSLIILGLLGAMLAGVGWFGVMKDYQKRRIITFIDPEHDLKGAGWNAVQSMIAVGSGRWFGKGHKGGTQTQLSFLPEQHTDFAFSVWSEEQGFIGCLFLLTLYALLVIMGLNIAMEARERYGSLLATGAVSIIAWQAIINMGMVSGALPVVGITLPLFSYGGSSVITVLLCAGILLNVHRRRRSY